MPLLSVQLIEGVFTAAQKREMIHKLTETMVGIEGEALRPYTMVVIQEVQSGDWGIGGTCFTTEAVRAKARGVPLEPAAALR
jgi:4-oxalocrotonate tautomerase